jgi:hypothetical protein
VTANEMGSVGQVAFGVAANGTRPGQVSFNGITATRLQLGRSRVKKE